MCVPAQTGCNSKLIYICNPPDKFIVQIRLAHLIVLRLHHEYLYFAGSTRTLGGP